MVVGVHKRAAGVFSNRPDAEKAMQELKDSGFAMDRVSIIARDADHQENIAGTQVREKVGDLADEGAKVGALSGGALGGLTGLLVGLGTLAIPGIGPIMLAGATATALATTLAGAGIGAAAGSLIGGLIGLGIPEERAKVYDERVQKGDYLVIIDGNDAEIAKAEEVLHRRGIEDYGVYHHPDGKNVTNNVTNVAENEYAVGYFSHIEDAESAINDLRNAGFPLSKITLINREPLRRERFAGINVGDRLDSSRWVLPDHRVSFYNERINEGEYIVIVSGTDTEIQRAAAILTGHGIKQWQIYKLNGSTTASLQTTKRAIGVFSHGTEAKAALTELRNAGFPMSQISIIAQDTNGSRVSGVDKNLPTGKKVDEGAKAGAATGGALGGLGGLLVGLGALAIPGVGPVIAGGAAATALATALTGGVIGAAAGSIAGGLVGLGIPENRARIYSDRFQRGDYLVMVDGTDVQIQQAEIILKNRGIQEFAIYNPSDIDNLNRPAFNRGVRQETPIAEVQRESSPVLIIDRRDEKV
ncbi:MAG: general stress protein [Gloeotrichia echinulata CP02]|jgi:hypothetical protein